MKCFENKMTVKILLLSVIVAFRLLEQPKFFNFSDFHRFGNDSEMFLRF